jgi:HAD superfamily hydrolase (TIGR01509 family)
VKAIIFDMDGLMVDTERLYIETGKEIAASFGKDVTEETLSKMMGKKQIESASIFVTDLGLDISAQEIMKIRASMYQEKLIKDITPMMGLFEILDAFGGKLKLAIATGSSEESVKIVLRQLKIETYFDVLQTSDKIQNGKPDPEIYLNAIDNLNLLPNECIVLEDSSNGALAGKRAGCYVIAVPSKYTAGQDFSFVDYIALDLIDAMEHIQKKFMV